MLYQNNLYKAYGNNSEVAYVVATNILDALDKARALMAGVKIKLVELIEEEVL